MTGASPEFIGDRLPLIGCGDALCRQIVHIFRILQIRRMGTGFLYHLCQCPLVVQQRAGPQQIIGERLPLAVCHKERRLQCLQQRLFPESE